MSGFNSTGSAMYVNAWGGSGNVAGNPCSGQVCGNTCNLAGISSGLQVAYDVDNNNVSAKSCSISFMVAPGGSYAVTSDPYGNPYRGSFYVSLYGQP